MKLVTKVLSHFNMLHSPSNLANLTNIISNLVTYNHLTRSPIAMLPLHNLSIPLEMQ
jgi:hypothetical protein